MPAAVIIVGGGLAGLSAAHTVLERGGSVIVIDKNPFFGGNSTKATSGINGAGTAAQRKNKIADTPEVFYEDTAKSAKELLRPPLVKVLTYQSGAAVEWLQDSFGLDLSILGRLGGHSYPRTHRGPEKFPGMTITYALMEKLEEVAEKMPGRVQLIKKAKVTKLLSDSSGVTGVEYEISGSKQNVHGPVILATGGYAADFSSDSLIRKYRPELYDLPTTNGDHSTGDGMKLVEAIGGKGIDLEKIQVHPTGLVDPKDPSSKVKFLAAEALRGCGALILDANGDRICDELGRRDYVTGEMNKNKGPFRLVLNGAASNEIEWHCKHYCGRGLMTRFSSGQDVAKSMGIPANKLRDTFQKYNEVAKTGQDPYGKKFFQNVPFKLDDFFHVAIITPVLHFTMGGLEIDEHSQVIGANGQPIKGLFASGEVAGGVHGVNRLGGSSLLGCVVYGRVSGATAAKYLLENSSTQSAAAQDIKITVGDVEITVAQKGSSGSQKATGSSTSAAVQAKEAPAKKKADTSRAISAAEVAKHNKKDDCWVTINGQVLDVTKFLPDHPGGAKAILLFAGKDASEEFNMLHKPDVIQKYAPDTVIGVAAGKGKL